MNPKTYIGKGSITHLEKILESRKGKKIFLVTGKSSYKSSGVEKQLKNLLKDNPYIRFIDFEDNPKFEDVLKGITVFEKENCELTIAAGGGSAIDVAKAINSLANYDGDVKEAIKTNHISKKPPVLIAIPTTAGTGSEATHFSVIYIDGEKFSFAHNYLLPDYVIVEPTFTYSAPAYLTACTGGDALCQAIESIWAVAGNEESAEYAEKAIMLIWDNLEKAVTHNDHSSKDKVSEGSYWAGKAINISKTTAPHALSYKITTLFNVPHGHAVALTLTKVMEANYEGSKEKIDKIISLIGADGLSDAVEKIETLWCKIGLTMKLSELGIGEKDIPQISKCNPERLGNNPVVFSKEYIEGLFMSIK